MAAGEQADEQPVDHVFLTDDAQRHLPADVLDQAGIGGRGGLCWWPVECANWGERMTSSTGA